MKNTPLPILLALICLFNNALCCYAQEENNQVSIQGKKYIDFKTKKLEKYNSRLTNQQDHLLKKLKKKEAHFAHRLKKNDSAAYSRYQQQSLSYDSISTLSSADSGSNLANAAKKKNATVDSLKKIQGFWESKAAGVGGTTKNGELNKLQGELNYHTYINDLITRRTSFLKSMGGGQNLPGLSGIEKQVFYGKAIMKAFKEIADEPSAAEDKALEYLQGTAGFEKYMSHTDAPGGMGVGTDASQLEKMGYQTKQQLQKNLQGKFGENLSGVSKQLGGGLKQWQQQQKKIGELKQNKQALKQLKNTEKPAFKINPMRGLPFWKRIEKQYNWQATRAINDLPAMLETSAMAGFKHTPKLTYGLGLAYSEGLGQGWQNIHFSFQGIGYRTFAKWDWQYGIGAYAGYERIYKSAAFFKHKPQPNDAIPTTHDTRNYTESTLIGLTKSYNINTKHKGALQVLYDIWWQQKGLNNPIVLRFVTVKK